MSRFLIIASLWCSLASAAATENGGSYKPIDFSELMIRVEPGQSREIAWTNKNSGVFYTETNGTHRASWQGWRISSVEMMENYSITIDGRKLDPAFSRAECTPHQIARVYPGGLREACTLLDSVDAIVVELSNIHGNVAAIRPYFSDSRNPGDYKTYSGKNVLLIARQRHLHRSPEENYPVWIGVSSPGRISAGSGNDTSEASFSPSVVKARVTGRRCTFVIVAGDTPEQTVRAASEAAANFRKRIGERRNRMETLLHRSYVQTDNPRFDKALNWAKLSVDALIMNQRGKGIFAGLPWFDNYWGRDSFIALAGATLVTGDYNDAREILRSFARWQEKDSSNINYGRIPNFVSTTSVAYNTADGTPRFVIALDQYIRYSGDTAMIREMYPVVSRSIEGTIRYHTDTLGFLTHGDAETWMDAVGPDGSWSPRGNRANDIQELWRQQLEAGITYAGILGDHAAAKRWAGVKSNCVKNFLRYFFDPSTGMITDHLRTDGTADGQVRPNQFFALSMPGVSGSSSLFRKLTSALVYTHGVASLSQDDENFHPFHHFEPVYVQDAAYHNGIVWTWLDGVWIDEAVRRGYSDLAWKVTSNMTHQILDRGAVGTLSELLDAVPRTGEAEPRLSGTFSQAWSLAEYIRTFYQAYTGLQCNGGQWTIMPSLPDSISSVVMNITIDTTPVTLNVKRIPDGWDLSCKTAQMKRPVRQQIGSGRVMSLRVTSGGEVQCEETGQSTGRIPSDSAGAPALAVPSIRPDCKSLSGPSYPILTNSDVKRWNPLAAQLIDVDDPDGDDVGPGSYTYPRTVNLRPGSLDIIHFRVSADSNDCYFTLRFRDLSNPGWHPEYGYQLTFTAIAIDTGGPGGEQKVALNSRYSFGGDFRYHRLIAVGGGVRITGSDGKISAEYLPAPADVANPLGNASAGTISFAVPLRFIGTPRPAWRFAVLVGCQDDHGGAGLGEFRTVSGERQEWTGGGKADPDGSNIYDTILPVPIK